jgi:hypothetical protein
MELGDWILLVKVMRNCEETGEVMQVLTYQPGTTTELRHDASSLFVDKSTEVHNLPPHQTLI